MFARRQIRAHGGIDVRWMRDDVLVDAASKQELLNILQDWRDQDEPLVEAIGDALAKWRRMDSQEQARRIVDTVCEVLDREL